MAYREEEDYEREELPGHDKGDLVNSSHPARLAPNLRMQTPTTRMGTKGASNK
jgi:hypothetical protein